MTFNKLHRIILLIGIYTLTGILLGTPTSAQDKNLDWLPFEEALELAKEHDKPIMVDVWAPWCGWCKKLQKEVYPELAAKLNNEFVLTRLNRDDNETQKQYRRLSLTPLRLAQKLNVQNVPAIIFLSPEGEYLFHVSGFVDAERLNDILDFVVINLSTSISGIKVLTIN